MNMGRLKPNEFGQMWGPACRACKQVKDWAKCRPMRIQARTVNNAKYVFQWEFCSPECLEDFMASDNWKKFKEDWD